MKKNSACRLAGGGLLSCLLLMLQINRGILSIGRTVHSKLIQWTVRPKICRKRFVSGRMGQK